MAKTPAALIEPEVTVTWTLAQARHVLSTLESDCTAYHNHIHSAVQTSIDRPDYQYRNVDGESMTPIAYAQYLSRKLDERLHIATILRGRILRADGTIRD